MYKSMRALSDLSIKNETVLVRTDYNVPLEQLEDGSWQVTSLLRIRASLPTIQYLREHGARKIILCSHLGRPQGKDKALSLRPVAEQLGELMEGVPVDFVDEITGPEVASACESLPKGGILLLENLRFDPGEKSASEDFARELIESTGATAFVFDGFGVAHRATATTTILPELLPSAAGLLVTKEVETLSRLLDRPEHPFVTIIGGAKVEDKEPLISKFLPLADQILVGGKIASDGYTSTSPKIYVAEDFDTDGAGAKLDIGPISAHHFIEKLTGAKTVLWNGVLGKVEDPAFSTSSEIIAKFLGEHADITSVICGGDTSGFVENLLEKDPELQYTLLSTGGGATLQFLTGAELPALVALSE